MEYFLRAASYVRADNLLVEVAIAHNPYAKATKIDRLPRYLRRQMQSARVGEPLDMDARHGGSVGMTGEAIERQLGQLSGLLGKVKRVNLSREEFMKRQRAQQ